MPEGRPFGSDLLVRLPIALAWIATAVTLALLLLLTLLIVGTRSGSSGWDGFLELLWTLVVVAAIAVSSLVGTVCALIGLRTRYGPANRKSLRASGAINGVVLLACLALYAVSSFILPRGAPTEMFVRASGVWYRPGDRESVSLTVSWSDGDDRELPNPVWSSTNTAVFTVTPSGMQAVVSAVAPGSATLQVTSLGKSAELDIRVVEAAPAPPAGLSPEDPPVVISQFRLAGPRGPDDDFVEVRNRSKRTVDISGWTVAVSDGGGAAETIGRVPADTSLGPGCPYVFSSARLLFGDRPRPNTGHPFIEADFPFWPPVPPDGGFALVAADGRIVDQAGSRGSRYVEGTPLPANGFPTGGGYTRTKDTNDNASDFVVAPNATPTTYESTCGAYPSR